MEGFHGVTTLIQKTTKFEFQAMDKLIGYKTTGSIYGDCLVIVTVADLAQFLDSSVKIPITRLDLWACAGSKHRKHAPHEGIESNSWTIVVRSHSLWIFRHFLILGKPQMAMT